MTRFNPTTLPRHHSDHTLTKEEIEDNIEYMQSKFNYEYEQGKLKSPKYEIEYTGIYYHDSEHYARYPHLYYKLYSKKLSQYFLRQIEFSGANIRDIGFEKHHGKYKTYIEFCCRTFSHDWQSGKE
jgi:hypothetical protein